MEIRIKRIYEQASPDDCYRVLVDRLWHRGIKKDNAKIDLWLKEIAPSNEFRKWYSHDPEKWEEFESKYFKELHKKKYLIDELIKKARKQKLKLFISSKKEFLINAAALKEYIENTF